MKLIQLEILNLASLDRKGGEKVNFVKGALGDSTIFSIVGPTGSGKSTILDAICLALYGRAPRYPKNGRQNARKIEILGTADTRENNRIAPTDPRNILTRGKNEGYSRLTFLANDGIMYRAKWYVRFKRSNYDNVITTLDRITTSDDGNIIKEQADWNDLPKIIGLDYEQFLRTVLIAQGSFANFLTADENERYELLEKLIGCEEMYSRIAMEIKAKKDEAVQAFNLINADFTAFAKDIITDEEELSALKVKISHLEEAEKKVKSELEKVNKAIDWYTQEERYTKHISDFEASLKEAEQNLNGIRENVVRLQLHDRTIDAVSIYKDIKTTEKNIDDKKQEAEKLKDKIEKTSQKIKEEEKSLSDLQNKEKDAVKELENQKPHINKARELKVELVSAQASVEEKKKAKSDAEKANNKAEQDVVQNAKSIKDAERAWGEAKEAFEKIKDEQQKVTTNLTKEATDKSDAFTQENVKLVGKDAKILQDTKSNAERTMNDLKDGIRILHDINEKQKVFDGNANQKGTLSTRNATIEEELKELSTGALKEEIDSLTKVYTLMTSDNWELHRHSLKEGEACPLCGATSHPYHEDSKFAPVANDLKNIIDRKTKEYNYKNDSQTRLNAEKSKNAGTIETLTKLNESLQIEISNLRREWDTLHVRHTDWPEDEKALRDLLPQIEADATNSKSELEAYNVLVKSVDKLRKEKEKAETELQNYKDTAVQELRKAQENVNEADTRLKTEKGKTENLLAQRKEKGEILKEAIDALKNVQKEANDKEKELKGEIGDKDPDTYEKNLEGNKTKASNDVMRKNDDLVKLRGDKKELEGKMKSADESLNTYGEELTRYKDSLSSWLDAFNGKADIKLSVEDIDKQYSTKEDWESIRTRKNTLENIHTQADTTLKNEQKAHSEHQQNKPMETQEDLTKKKAELVNTTNEELVSCKATLKRHDDAIAKTSDLTSSYKSAEERKRDWEEISDAIGGDGKTLRKIAQCYTLGFLVEHANVEIRKFNSRYELQQVKNSLGIRVIDHDRADDVRDTTSLSGGETFIVSLGLALGLSSLSSRNISFENLFIDEGFGTLDPDTLATVIDSLAMLQSSQGKKVGVISHTDTMSERITTQIRIIKNGNSGSSHIEIHP